MIHALLATGLGAFLTAAGTVGLLPADGFLPGWERSGRATTFVGADLYNHIDGGAEVFLELGFERAVVQEYAHGDDEITVELYTMSDEIAAAGIYLMKRGAETHDRRIPGRHAYAPRQVLLYRGRTVVIVTNDTGARAETAMVAAATAVAARLPASAPIPLADTLPAEGRVAGSLRLIRGPFTLRTVYTFGEGDSLQLGGRLTAVAADYDLGVGGRRRRILVRYPSPDDARAALDHLAATLDPTSEIVEREPDRLVVSDWADRRVVVEAAGATIDIRIPLEATS